MPAIHPSALLLAALCGAAILLLFLFATGPLRSLFGDVVIVVFLVASLASISVGSPRGRVIGVAMFALAVELFQGLGLVGPDAHWLLHLTIGSTTDPLDLGAYAAGTVLAALAERWYARSPAAPLRRPVSGSPDR